MGEKDKKPTLRKKAVVLRGVDQKARANLRNSDQALTANLRGVDGDALIEPVPKYIQAPSEKILKNNKCFLEALQLATF